MEGVTRIFFFFWGGVGFLEVFILGNGILGRGFFEMWIFLFLMWIVWVFGLFWGVAFFRVCGIFILCGFFCLSISVYLPRCLSPTVVREGSESFVGVSWQK